VQDQHNPKPSPSDNCERLPIHYLFARFHAESPRKGADEVRLLPLVLRAEGSASWALPQPLGSRQGAVAVPPYPGFVSTSLHESRIKQARRDLEKATKRRAEEEEKAAAPHKDAVRLEHEAGRTKSASLAKAGSTVRRASATRGSRRALPPPRRRTPRLRRRES
jgi:hypothetical protein